MHGASRRTALAFLILLTLAGPSDAARPEPSVAAERPDPATVTRYGPAYRYPRAGWIVVHVEGSPYDRGYQHGRLLSAEIADYAKTLATKRSPNAPADAWRETRTMVNALFLRRYDREYLEEMKGIADGAAAAGATLLGRPIDFIDVVTINSDIELEFLDSALDATPNGLEGRTFREPVGHSGTPAPPEHCSAFAATGPATADGKIVFGHITMFSIAFVRHFNVWLDVKPDHGHRVLMQTYPGGIQSGMDYYLNDAGLIVAETTIKQTKFDVNGQALASRIRRALQYSDTIDQAVATLKEGNNGMYTNEWLLADTKTDEVAMFELGTHKSMLWRSSKDEWFGGTKGFYWGCNNAKDLDVRLETVSSPVARPANLVWRPTDRDKTWIRLYEKHKGSISEKFGFEAFTTPPLSAFPSCDAKFTTSAMAKELKTWALFGPPLGKTWQPSDAEKRRFPDAQPLVSNDWTILTADAPAGPERPEKVARPDSRRALPAANARLRELRDTQAREVEKARREVTRRNDKVEALRGVPDVILLEGYRRWSDELTNVEVKRIAAKARLDQLRMERSRNPGGVASVPSDAGLEAVTLSNPRVTEVEYELEKSRKKLAAVVRVARATGDPAVLRAKQKVQELAETAAELRRAPLGDRQTGLTQSGREQETLEAESDLLLYETLEEVIKGRLERTRLRARDAEGEAVKLAFVRKELERAEQVLEKIDWVLAEEAGVGNAAGAGDPPVRKAPSECLAVDLANPSTEAKGKDHEHGEEAEAPHGPDTAAWHGTILPQSDADVWLAAGFADYEKIVARENAIRSRAKGRELRGPEKDEIDLALFAPYSAYRTAVGRLGKDVPLAETRASVSDDAWYEIAAGKGVLLLAALRERVGHTHFLKVMDEFGRQHAGKEVSTESFVDAVRSTIREDLRPFFKAWLTETKLPSSPKTGYWSVHSYEAELDRTVIVYGTLKESDAQREAAGRLQRQIERRWSNVTVPILSDREATLESLKGRHVLLVGRPGTNAAAEKLCRDLPVTFGPASFVVRGETYAHPLTSVIAAGRRPDDPRHEVVVHAGLSAEATWRCVQAVGDRNDEPAEVLIHPASGKPRRLAVQVSEKIAEPVE